MIFDGRALDEIDDAEIAQMVHDHAAERRHLEFKLTFEYSDDHAKYEFLKDVTSLANAGGGYLFIGIRDDGSGRALRFEGLEAKVAKRIAQVMASVCLEHIAERIPGLEIRHRCVDDSHIIAVRVPVSDLAPHMVSFHHNTHFPTRTEHGKREMSYGEIRAAFLDGPLGRRLGRVESALDSLVHSQTAVAERGILEKALERSAVELPPDVTNGRLVLEFYEHRFHSTAADKPFFWMCAVPSTAREHTINLSAPSIRRIFEDPPGPGGRPNSPTCGHPKLLH
jgi:hypothetical protein